MPNKKLIVPVFPRKELKKRVMQAIRQIRQQKDTEEKRS